MVMRKTRGLQTFYKERYCQTGPFQSSFRCFKGRTSSARRREWWGGASASGNTVSSSPTHALVSILFGTILRFETASREEKNQAFDDSCFVCCCCGMRLRIQVEDGSGPTPSDTGPPAQFPSTNSYKNGKSLALE